MVGHVSSLEDNKNRSSSNLESIKRGAVEEVEVDSILFTAALSACATLLHVLLDRPRNVKECLMGVGAQIFVNVYVSWFQNTLSIVRNPLGEYRQWILQDMTSFHRLQLNDNFSRKKIYLFPLPLQNGRS